MAPVHDSITMNDKLGEDVSNEEILEAIRYRNHIRFFHFHLYNK